ncbi:MAG TPA: hypothetical protein VFC78_02755 [Tepidisphaeraceae bacterium]|nr:hypothetical protein [Tepidisphaeraceae bacterium]
MELVRNLIRGDTEALDLLDKALVTPHGAPVGNQNAAKEKTIFDNINDCSDSAPTGNSAERAIRKLRKDAPTGHRAECGTFNPFVADSSLSWPSPRLGSLKLADSGDGNENRKSPILQNNTEKPRKYGI